jgi:hypothetical protein
MNNCDVKHFKSRPLYYALQIRIKIARSQALNKPLSRKDTQTSGNRYTDTMLTQTSVKPQSR